MHARARSRVPRVSYEIRSPAPAAPSSAAEPIPFSEREDAAMKFKIDTRILILGLFVVIGLLARPMMATPEYTGSIPTAEVAPH